MKIENDKATLELVIGLAERHATGTPAQLARKIGVSVRSVYRIKQALCAKNVKMKYSKVYNSYIIE